MHDYRKNHGTDHRHDPMTGFLNAIESFLAERGMAPSTFSQEVMGDPSFLRRMTGGRIPYLDTVDRVLAYMGREPVGPGFLREVETFLSVTRIKPYLFSREAAGNPSFVTNLRRGRRTRLDTVGKVRAWMDAHSTGEEKERIRALVSGPYPAVASGEFPGTRAGEATEATEATEANETTNEEEKTDMKTMNEPNREARMKGMNAMNPARPMPPRTTPEEAVYLDTRAAADFLSLSPRTLDRYRERGEGPAFHRFGARIRYLKSDVEAWASARRVVSGPKPDPEDGSA